jgi:hypothetical protein
MANKGMTDRVVVLARAYSGIGWQATRVLGAQGGRLVLAVTVTLLAVVAAVRKMERRM